MLLNVVRMLDPKYVEAFDKKIVQETCICIYSLMIWSTDSGMNIIHFIF